MVAGGGGTGRRPGRLHLPRPVRRPRPDHGPHRRDARATTSRPTDLLQGRSPRLDLDSLYGAGPGDPASARFFDADGLHLKTGRTIAVGADAAKDGPRPAACRHGPHPGGEAEGADPRPAQRREPDRRADPPRDDPLPQPGGRQAARLGAARRSGSARARKRVTLHYQWLIRHDYLPRICRPRVARRRVHERPQARRAGRRADRRTDDADRVLGRGVPARAQHDPRRLQLEPALPRHRRARWTSCSRSPALGGDLVGERPAAQQLDRRLAADVRLPGRRPARPRRARQQRQPGDADRHPADRPAARTCRRARSAATPRSPTTTCGATWPSAT